jgi:asparagine synthase (glutamine-hydrolysing)
MCGWIGRIRGANTSGDLQAGLQSLSRRGPDSAKHWHSANGQVELLHARLAIVDTDARAHQPFSASQIGLTLAFNGEIYNYASLKREFPNYPFRTESDTEIILACYQQHGIEGFKRFRGMFTLCLVDERRQHVILARDAIGKKPLYLARWNDELLFGSSLISLQQAFGKTPELNPDVNAYFWRKGFVHPAHSVLSGAQPLLPGQVMVFDFSGKLLSEHSCAPDDGPRYQGESAADVDARLHDLLRQAVERRLSNAVQPAALLSGGIDSTLIAAIAQDVCRARGQNLQTLSLRSLVPLMNDDFYSRYAANKLKTRSHMVSIPLRNTADRVLASMHRQDEPMAIPAHFMLDQLVHAASRYGKILLSGDGGDEVFLGYGKPSDWWSDPRTLSADDAPLVSSGPALPSWFSPWAQETSTNTLVGHMYAKADRASAEQGVELRCPLLDWDVVSYARSLPQAILAPDQRAKALLKNQLKQFPNWFLERPKIGFGYNLRWLWRLSGFAGLREHISADSQSLFAADVPSVLRQPASHWRSADIFANFLPAWKLLSYSLFLQRYRGRA